jgi:hypothetical protein
MSTIPTIPEARPLRDETVALGGSFPESLTRLLDVVVAVQSAPTAPNPAAKLVDAAVAGKASSPTEIAKLVSDAAKTEQEIAYFRRLQADIAKDAMVRFGAELRSGAGDLILDSIRPQLDETAAAIAAATAAVDISWTPDRLVSEGNPEQLAAWQQLPSLVARVDKIAALVAGFGRRGTFSLIDEPGHLVHNELVGLRDEALFLTDSDPWQASDFVNARRADWRSSPWVRLKPRLNTVGEAKERLRVQCEAAWNAMELSRGQRGTITPDGHVVDPKRPNPFASPEAA